MDNSTIFYSKTTNRELYKYRNIMEYHDGKYVLTNPISDKNIREMRINMDDSDVVDFDKFLERNWGIKPPKLDDDTNTENSTEVETKNRGRKPKTTLAEEG